jgi:MFS family permease
VDTKVRRLLVSHALASVALSLPWPWLLVLVWDDTHSPGLLGLAAASRMLPYVACSWWAARIGDRRRRDAVIRASLAARVVLLGALPGAVWLGHPVVAIALAALAVAVATPAYPALAAALPTAAGAASERATNALVTIEVASFVVGPALGGLLLVLPVAIGVTSVLASALAVLLIAGVRLDPGADAAREAPPRIMATLRGSATVRRCLAFLALLNLVDAAVGVTLLPLAHGGWTGGWGTDTAYGVTSAALGFGALAAPALSRWGSGATRRARIGVLAVGASVLVVAGAPTAAWALAPLALAGAAAVHAESAATNLLQVADDRVRASLFGVADAAMVGAALLGAVAAPSLAVVLGPDVLLAILGCAAVASALVVRGAGPDQALPHTTVAETSSSVSMLGSSPAAEKSAAVVSA